MPTARLPSPMATRPQVALTGVSKNRTSWLLLRLPRLVAQNSFVIRRADTPDCGLPKPIPDSAPVLCREEKNDVRAFERNAPLPMSGENTPIIIAIATGSRVIGSRKFYIPAVTTTATPLPTLGALDRRFSWLPNS